MAFTVNNPIAVPYPAEQPGQEVVRASNAPQGAIGMSVTARCLNTLHEQKCAQIVSDHSASGKLATLGAEYYWSARTPRHDGYGSRQWRLWVAYSRTSASGNWTIVATCDNSGHAVTVDMGAKSTTSGAVVWLDAGGQRHDATAQYNSWSIKCTVFKGFASTAGKIHAVALIPARDGTTAGVSTGGWTDGADGLCPHDSVQAYGSEAPLSAHILRNMHGHALYIGQNRVGNFLSASFSLPAHSGAGSGTTQEQIAIFAKRVPHGVKQATFRIRNGSVGTGETKIKIDGAVVATIALATTNTWYIATVSVTPLQVVIFEVTSGRTLSSVCGFWEDRNF